MREIKFRAWDKSTDRYIYSYEPDNQPKREYILVEFGIGFSHYKKEDLIIEQYTGFKDKNGKEIYEGDIIRCGKNGRVFIVKWEDGHFLFQSANESRIHFLHIVLNLKPNIIGNIHEKKELFK